MPLGYTVTIVGMSKQGMERKIMKKEEIFKTCEKYANTTVLSFEDRGPWGKSNYPGNCSGWIPASLIYRYGCQSVSEIFAGSGTTYDLCQDLEIPYTGIDLNPNPVRPGITSMDILDESLTLPNGFYDADLQFLHPPYPTINDIHYSGSAWKDTTNVSEKDIQEMSWEKGMMAINKAIMRGYAAMPSGAIQAVLCGDIRRKGAFRSMLRELAVPGDMIQVLVKMQHHTNSERKNCSYGKRNFFLIEHEFVVVVKKPSGYEIAYVLPKDFALDIRDSKTATWKDVVYAVMKKLGKAKLQDIYTEIEGHKKCQTNTHWKEKVRQILQLESCFSHSGPGEWAIAV